MSFPGTYQSLKLAVVNQWTDFVEGVICRIITAWHLLRIVEMEIEQYMPKKPIKYGIKMWMAAD